MAQPLKISLYFWTNFKMKRTRDPVSRAKGSARSWARWLAGGICRSPAFWVAEALGSAELSAALVCAGRWAQTVTEHRKGLAFAALHPEGSRRISAAFLGTATKQQPPRACLASFQFCFAFSVFLAPASFSPLALFLAAVSC